MSVQADKIRHMRVDFDMEGFERECFSVWRLVLADDPELRKATDLLQRWVVLSDPGSLL